MAETGELHALPESPDLLAGAMGAPEGPIRGAPGGPQDVGGPPARGGPPGGPEGAPISTTRERATVLIQIRKQGIGASLLALEDGEVTTAQ